MPVVVNNRCLETPQVQFLRLCTSLRTRNDKLGRLAFSGSASDSVHRADVWTFPFRSRKRCAQCNLCRVCLVWLVYDSFLRHFSHSVQLDVSARVAGTPGV